MKSKLNRTVLLATVLIATLSIACSKTPLQKEAAFLQAGRKHFQARDFARAMLDFKNAAQAMPRDSEPYYQLGLASIETGDRRSALAYLRKATELDPKNTAALLKLVEIESNSSNSAVLKDAQARANALLSVRPGDPDVFSDLALTEMRLGEREKAFQHLEQALAQTPQHLKSSMLLAGLKLANRDTAGAELVLKTAVEKDPRSAPPHVALGLFYRMVNKQAEAEAQFQNALQIDPKNGQALLGLAEIEAQTGRQMQAEQTYRRLSELPEKAYKPLHALYLFDQKRYDEAIAELERLARSDPKDRAARTRLVAAYLSRKRLADADRILTAALKQNPEDAEALLQRSQIYLGAGKLEEAQRDLTQTLRLRPDSAMAHYMLASVFRASGKQASEQQELGQALQLDPAFLDARLALVKSLRASREVKAAMDLLNQAPSSQKNSVPFIVQRNWILLETGDFSQCRKGIETGLAISRARDLLLQDAVLKLQEKQYAEARKSAEEVLAKNPEDLAALEDLMLSYSVPRQMPAGLKEVQKYVMQRPKSAVLHDFLGRWMVTAGKPDEARAEFIAAKSADPGFSEPEFALAELDLAEGKLDSARKEFTALLPDRGYEVPVRIKLANIEERSGNRKAAISDYRRILELNPDNVVALNNLAYDLADSGTNLDEALKYAQRVKELAPNLLGVEDTIGWALYQKGLYESSLKHLQNAATKEATARHRYHLAMVYFRTGDRRKAQTILNLALKQDPGLPEASMAKKVAADTAN